MTEPADHRATPDFTKPREPIRFTLGGVDYAAPAIISPMVLKKLAAIGQRWQAVAAEQDPETMLGVLGEAFELLVPGPGGQDIRARITTEHENPIDLQAEALPCFTWLMGQYTGRPTQLSSLSPNGSPTPSDDTSSTPGSSPTDSENETSTAVTG